MTKYRLEISNHVERILEKIAIKEPLLYKRFVHGLDDLERNPKTGKPLKGKLKGRYSYRIGSHRIIYLIKKKLLIVFVIDIGNRRDIYKGIR